MACATGSTAAIEAAAPLAARLDPLPRRVTVEVLNSGKVVGAARAGTVLLRDAGLDVVSYGTAGGPQSGRVRSQVLVRRRDTTGVGRVVAAIGRVDILDAPDSTRLVDLTVLIGKDFVLPATLRP